MSEQSGKKLKEYMIKHDLNPWDLSKALNISRTSLWRYLNGGNVQLNIRKKIQRKTKKEILAEDLA